MKLFITGRPGIGKTTVIKKVVESIDKPLSGFFTEEIRESGVRKGFKIKAVGGGEGVLAHIAFSKRFKVGKYGVDVEGFERVAIPGMERASLEGRLLVIDEIARMELFSERFKKFLVDALNSGCDIIASIQDRREPFLDGIRSRRDVEVVRVTETNRNELHKYLIDKLG